MLLFPPKFNIKVLCGNLIGDLLRPQGKEESIYEIISLLFYASGTKLALKEDVMKELALPAEIIEYIEE